MQVRTARVAGFSDVTDDIALGYVSSSFCSYRFQMRIGGLVTVLVINDNSVSEVATMTCKSDFSTARCKNRVAFAGGNVDSQVLVFVRELFADDAYRRNDVRNSFHPAFVVSREPVVDTFEIDVVLAGRHVRETVALDDAVDFVGVVFEERLEDILDSVFHNPQRVESGEQLFVVRVLLHELRIVDTHFFIVHESLVDLDDVDNEKYEDNGEQDKPDVEQHELLARNAVLLRALRIFRNNLDGVIFTTHVITVSGFPSVPEFGSGRPWNNS